MFVELVEVQKLKIEMRQPAEQNIAVFLPTAPQPPNSSHKFEEMVCYCLLMKIRSTRTKFEETKTG
jgi:hypothetical protein